MPKTVVAYCGWIGGKPSDRPALEAICHRVGDHDGELAFKGCEVFPENMDRLREEWTRYIWGLIPKKILVALPGELEEEDVPF